MTKTNTYLVSGKGPFPIDKTDIANHVARDYAETMPFADQVKYGFDDSTYDAVLALQLAIHGIILKELLYGDYKEIRYWVKKGLANAYMKKIYSDKCTNTTGGKYVTYEYLVTMLSGKLYHGYTIDMGNNVIHLESSDDIMTVVSLLKEVDIWIVNHDTKAKEVRFGCQRKSPRAA